MTAETAGRTTGGKTFRLCVCVFVVACHLRLFVAFGKSDKIFCAQKEATGSILHLKLTNSSILHLKLITNNLVYLIYVIIIMTFLITHKTSLTPYPIKCL